MQPVILHRMIENGAELIVERFQIDRRIRISVLILAVQHFVLPCDDIFGLNIIDLSLPEIRENLRAENMILGMPGVFLDPTLHICRIGLYEAGKGHIQIRFRLIELFTLPGQGFPFRQKATLCRLLSFSLPVSITIVDLPSVCLRFLVDSHSNHFLSLFSAVP